MKRLGAAALIALALAGCQTDGALVRHLPDWPAMCRGAAVKEPRPGEELLVIAARERSGRLKANRTIRACGEWYSSVAEDYARPPS